MGLLSTGTPMPFRQVAEHANDVRRHGIIQFLALYQRHKDKQNDSLRFGDEVEYMIVAFDHEKHTVRLSLCGPEVLDKLQSEEEEQHRRQTQQAGQPSAASQREGVQMLWRPEYGAFMLEGTPGQPYGYLLRDFVTVEESMRLRRQKAQSLLQDNEVAMTLTSYPLMGCGAFTDPVCPTRGPFAQSLFFPDDAIHPFPRFPWLTRNIRERRGSRVVINVPIFHDSRTPRPFMDALAMNGDDESRAGAVPDHVYMDAMGFGMGCCCLQVTFQACNIGEARHLYDQLATVSPIMLALTAAAPIFRGYLVDVDCRWGVISASVDDRTPSERGVIRKSRYDSIDCYIGQEPTFKPEYNDIPVVVNDQVYQQLHNAGIDHLLAQHLAHLFIRDPLVLFQEQLTLDDTTNSDHFENIQSTNWQTMRFKPPPANSDIGWRVEFRAMEVQLTDFENAAFAVFIMLLTRMILSFNLNLYIPISKVPTCTQPQTRRRVSCSPGCTAPSANRTDGGKHGRGAKARRRDQ